MIPQLICVAAACAMIKFLPSFDVVKSLRIAMPRTSEIALAESCEVMNNEGKLDQILANLNADAEELSKMRIAHDPQKYQTRIHELEFEIRESVAHAKSILRPEWTDLRWPYQAKWNIRFSDFVQAKPEIIDYAFEMVDFELESIQLAGIEREDLYPLVDVSWSKSSMQIELVKRASTLELCQLQATLIISGKTKFRFQGQLFERQTELTLRPGAIYVKEVTGFPSVGKKRDEDIRCKYLGICGHDFGPDISDFFPLPFPIPKGPVGPGGPN